MNSFFTSVPGSGSELTELEGVKSDLTVKSSLTLGGSKSVSSFIT